MPDGSDAWSEMKVVHRDSFDNRMKRDSRNKAEKFWNRTAANYDQEEKKDEKTYLQIIEKSKGYLKPTDVVLDFACGTGNFSIEISKYVKKIRAIDSSIKMIGIAKTKTQKQEIQNVDYLQATIFDESLKPDSFDVILSFYILHLADDPHTVIKKMHGLLKPGGMLISVTPCMGEKPFLSGLFYVFSRFGIVPQMNSFKTHDLAKLLTNEGFGLIENKLLPETSNQYFMAAIK